MGERGQSAIEFIIVMGCVTFLFLGFLIAIRNNISDETERNKDLLLKEVALTVQNEIAIASTSIDGYYRNFSIPVQLIGYDYSARIQNGLIYLNTSDGQHGLALPVANSTGSLILGSNIIRKASGVVYLNQ